MREFIIQADDANQRVDKFITKTMKTLPKSLMYKYIRNKKIKVNNKRCDISQRLLEGDSMQCYIAEEFFDMVIQKNFLKVPSKLQIIYEDESILIVDKPSGLLAHSDTSEVQDNLADRMLHYLYKKGEFDPALRQSFSPALCHRIDRNTQGIVIGAKSADALRKMNEKIKLREVEKKYICIVEGALKQKEDHIVLYHKKLEGNKADISKVAQEGYQEIQTAYRVLEEGRGYSLVEVDLLTGKSHQIRSVMAYIGHPLLGDRKYGARESSYAYQALCAYKVTFRFLGDDEPLTKLNGKTFVLPHVGLFDYFKKHCQ